MVIASLVCLLVRMPNVGCSGSEKFPELLRLNFIAIDSELRDVTSSNEITAGNENSKTLFSADIGVSDLQLT